MARRARGAVAVRAALVAAPAVLALALALSACSGAPVTAASTAARSPTASPTPTLAPASCTWTGVRQELDSGPLGHLVVQLTNTSPGTCVLDGAPTVALTGGPRGQEGVPAGTAAGLPAGPVVVPPGASAYAPVALATTTDGGIAGHCSDSRHTTLLVTPPGSPSTVSIDVTLLHPCTPIAGFGWTAYPIQAAMPAAAAFG
ncbi:DUF4232 domain-containing protein [Pseudolysinimonas sp.]|uniref:DUF4232 domain-containing protein n=1 Tax=Pseudolysinimonas sp. TaxID=2680009 RepID=UPI003F7F5317